MGDLGKIHNGGQHLLKLVNEILDLSKIEAGKMELDLQETLLADLLDEIITEAEPLARQNGNTIIAGIDPSLGSPLCDARKLRNAISQLIDNAVKFTQNGRIKLVAECHPGETTGELVVHVIDTGIEIAKEQLSGLFEKFTVIDNSSTSKYGGTGLGLALSDKLCRLMGARSSSRAKSEREAALPSGCRCSGAAARQMHSLQRRSFLPPRILHCNRPWNALVHKILLVEDNEINRDMLTRRLQRHGFSVCCAHDGAAGVAMAASEMPDLILMDVALGEIDGWEATQLIKANPATAVIPVIALTAHALASDRDKSVEVGCCDFDTKPVDMQRLLGKIRARLPAIAAENVVA